MQDSSNFYVTNFPCSPSLNNGWVVKSGSLTHAHHISWSTIPDVNRGILPKVFPDYAKATILSKHPTAVINQNQRLISNNLPKTSIAPYHFV